MLSTGTPSPDTALARNHATAPAIAQRRRRRSRHAVAFDPERLYAAVGPAVVTISNKQKIRSGAPRCKQANFGSGVIFDARGYIITNRHVVDGAEAIDIMLQDGTVVPGTLVGEDTVVDLAVVKIDAAAVPAVASLGDSALVRTGQHVVAIGSPNQFESSVTRGIISGTDRTVGGVDGMVQTDAPISRGNSGGALVNAGGEVIGITTGYITTNQVERVAFAIPSNSAKQLAGMIVASGKVTRPYHRRDDRTADARAGRGTACRGGARRIHQRCRPEHARRAGRLAHRRCHHRDQRDAGRYARPAPARPAQCQTRRYRDRHVNRGGVEQPISVTLVERPAAAPTPKTTDGGEGSSRIEPTCVASPGGYRFEVDCTPETGR